MTDGRKGEKADGRGHDYLPRSQAKATSATNALEPAPQRSGRIAPADTATD